MDETPYVGYVSAATVCKNQYFLQNKGTTTKRESKEEVEVFFRCLLCWGAKKKIHYPGSAVWINTSHRGGNKKKHKPAKFSSPTVFFTSHYSCELKNNQMFYFHELPLQHRILLVSFFSKFEEITFFSACEPTRGRFHTKCKNETARSLGAIRPLGYR